MRNDKVNVIVNKTEDFALAIIDFSEEIYKMNRFKLANQLFASGTSIGANVFEAQNAESRIDFIHKMKIAAKEADETAYCLRLCNIYNHLPSNEKLSVDLLEINKILSKIIFSSKSIKPIVN